MSDPADGTIDSTRESGPTAAEPVDDSSLSGGELRPGSRWRNLIVRSAVAGGAPRTFLADHVGLMEQVVVRSFPVTDSTEWRRGAWERLATLPDSRVVACLESHEENGWRYEISAVPPAMNLREWMACHRPGFADVEAFIRQMAAALGALHAQGVVHLNLRPETIHIDETKGEPVYLLGGLHEATLYTQPELMPAEVDPFYAPPEAAGLTKHPPGTRLCAWDWWSVGRIVQEFLLGQHVFALVFERDVSRVTPELRAKAQQLLLEREPPGVRAGALDFTVVDAGYMPLLRGLLTSSCDARWGLDAIQRWLRREPVRDHYDLPRTARMWNWRGRIFTLPEAVEFFTAAENWETGEDMLFHPHEPETLAAFLQSVPAHRADWERLQAVCDLAESSAWERVPVVVRRTLTAAAAWLSLAAGGGNRATFRVRGQTIDLAGLGELLRVSGPEAGVALVSALILPPVIQFVEPLDAAAGRMLKAMAAKGGAAVQQALQHGWLDPNDLSAQARMFELALASGATLRERVDLLRAGFATNSDPVLAAMLANKTPKPDELVVLAFTGEAPEKYGYITHENWRRQQCAELKARGETIASKLLWLRIERLLGWAFLWGVRPHLFAAVTLAATAAVGVMTRAVGPAAATAGVLLFSRAWVWWRIRWLVRRFDPAAAPWAWNDGRDRARGEATRVLETRGVSGAALARELNEVRRTLKDLATSSVQPPAVREPQLADLWLAISAAVAVTVVAFAQPAAPSGFSEDEIAEDAKPAPLVLAPESVAESSHGMDDATADPATLVASGRYEVVDDGFGRRLRGPLKRWEMFSPASVEKLDVLARAPLSPEQAAFALVSGTLLLQPYPRHGVHALLAIRVPTTRGFGIVIFNGRDHHLTDREMLLVSPPLQKDTWYEVDGRRVVFLGEPLPLELEISLAPR